MSENLPNGVDFANELAEFFERGGKFTFREALDGLQKFQIANFLLHNVKLTDGNKHIRSEIQELKDSFNRWKIAYNMNFNWRDLNDVACEQLEIASRFSRTISQDSQVFGQARLNAEIWSHAEELTNASMEDVDKL